MQKLKLIFDISLTTCVVSAAVLFRSSSISRREIKNVKNVHKRILPFHVTGEI